MFVAQFFKLLFRRILFCGVLKVRRGDLRFDPLQIENLRNSRVKLCVTLAPPRNADFQSAVSQNFILRGVESHYDEPDFDPLQVGNLRNSSFETALPGVLKFSACFGL